MKVEITGYRCVVTKEAGDKNHFYGIVNASGESALLYAIKNVLNKQGYDLIKKRMYKDGHLVDDIQQYIRARKKTGNPEKDICIYNGNWQIHGAEQHYNEYGTVSLNVEKDIFADNTGLMAKTI